MFCKWPSVIGRGEICWSLWELLWSPPVKYRRLSRMIWIIPPESRILDLRCRKQDPSVWRGLVEFLDSRGRTLLQVSSPRNISNKCTIYEADHTKYDVKHHLNKWCLGNALAWWAVQANTLWKYSVCFCHTTSKHTWISHWISCLMSFVCSSFQPLGLLCSCLGCHGKLPTLPICSIIELKMRWNNTCSANDLQLLAKGRYVGHYGSCYDQVL